MKILKLICWASFMLCCLHVPAINSIAHSKEAYSSRSLWSTVTVEQFLAMDINRLHQSGLFHANWLQRQLLRQVQKKLAKKVAAGKLDQRLNVSDAVPHRSNNNQNTRGLLSVIFGGLGFIFLLLGSLSILSIPFAIAALILGIIGIKKDKNNTMAIIGLVFGGTVILLLILAIALIATYI